MFAIYSHFLGALDRRRLPWRFVFRVRIFGWILCLQSPDFRCIVVLLLLLLLLLLLSSSSLPSFHVALVHICFFLPCLLLSITLFHPFSSYFIFFPWVNAVFCAHFCFQILFSLAFHFFFFLSLETCSAMNTTKCTWYFWRLFQHAWRALFF